MKTIVQKNNFLKIINMREYKLEEVLPCIIKQDGDNWTIDHFHPSFPRPKHMSHEQYIEIVKQTMENTKNQNVAAQNPPEEFGEGAGTELKKLLKMIGITSTPNCSCNARAKLMNQNGIQWCKDNIDTIVVWLKEEATKRNLPFFTYGAKKLVKLAISRAEHAQTG